MPLLCRASKQCGSRVAVLRLFARVMSNPERCRGVVSSVGSVSFKRSRVSATLLRFESRWRHKVVGKKLILARPSVRRTLIQVHRLGRQQKSLKAICSRQLVKRTIGRKIQFSSHPSNSKCCRLSELGLG